VLRSSIFEYRAMDGDHSLGLTDKEISLSFLAPLWAERFPPILSVEQAGELLQIPVATIYEWRSRGLLGGCSHRLGKYVRFYRDRLIKQVFNEGIHHDG
jgi:excisionase family DNA binding protein